MSDTQTAGQDGGTGGRPPPDDAALQARARRSAGGRGGVHRRRRSGCRTRSFWTAASATLASWRTTSKRWTVGTSGSNGTSATSATGSPNPRKSSRNRPNSSGICPRSQDGGPAGVRAGEAGVGGGAHAGGRDRRCAWFPEGRCAAGRVGEDCPARSAETANAGEPRCCQCGRRQCARAAATDGRRAGDRRQVLRRQSLVQRGSGASAGGGWHPHRTAQHAARSGLGAQSRRDRAPGEGAARREIPHRGVGEQRRRPRRRCGQRRKSSPQRAGCGQLQRRRRQSSRTTQPRGFDTLPKVSKDAYVRDKRMLDGKGEALTEKERAHDYYLQEQEYVDHLERNGQA